ncbi:TPA: polysaccharide pyruvyl transferase family protein [Raoultella planticola]|nr:hypothetical protein [Raoultella planticola]
MKVLIINQHTNNFGDDAAGVALMSSLLRDKHEIDVTYIWNKNGTKVPLEDSLITHHVDANLSRSNLVKEIFSFVLGKKGYFHKIAKLARQSDYVLVSPGGANIGIYKDWAYLVNVIVSRVYNKNVIFHLNTISKSNSHIFNFLAKHTLRKCIMFVREKASYDLLKTQGIVATLGVDTAFMLEKLDKSLDSSDKNIITFVPTELSNWHVHFKGVDDHDLLKNKIIPSLSKFAKDGNYVIKILPHLYSSEAEGKFLKMLETEFRNKGIETFIDTQVTDFYKYDQSIADSSLVVSMRYHGVVLSVKNQIPVISLSYENKMKECCRYSGILSQNIDLLNFDAARLDSLLNSTLVNPKRTDNDFLRKMASAVVDFIAIYNR